jgi:TctA family transporter
MAKQGKAAHALSLAFLCSMAGGVIGAIGLTFTIPIARPLVLSFGSPEIFMLAVLGVSLTALVSGGNQLRGLVSAALGLLFGMVGAAPSVATYRFTFGAVFLYPGLALGVVAIGVFGIAEVANLVATRRSVGGGLALQGRWMDGVHDFMGNWALVLRGALVGIWAGVLPGVGATAGAFMAYGQTVATSNDKRKFGKGDPRGIVGPESAANSCEGGDLVPTLLFGIPGAASAALLMGALLYYGIEPGPRLITDHLDSIYSIIWSLALGSIIASLLCFPLAVPLAKLTTVPLHRLAPALILIMMVGSFQTSYSFGDLAVLLVFGVLGWVMKRADFPRAPLLIGFVLSKPLERYYFLTDSLYTPAQWMLRPYVLIMFAILIAPIVIAVVKLVRRRRLSTAVVSASVPNDMVAAAPPARSGMSRASSGGDAAVGTESTAPRAATVLDPATTPPPHRTDHVWSFGFTVIAAVLVSSAFVLSLGYEADARLAPRLVSAVGIIVLLLLLVVELRALRSSMRHERSETSGADRWPSARAIVAAFLWIASVPVLSVVLGFTFAAIVFMIAFLWRVSRMKPVGIAIYVVAVVALLFVVTQWADFKLPGGIVFLSTPWGIG